MILFDISHDTLNLIEPLLGNMRLILLLGLEKEVLDEHCCLKEDNADLNGGNLFHIFDILSKTC